MFDLDLRSRQPIYEQLVEKFKRLIITGVLKSDAQLPSVRQLAGQLTINPNTIQKAYRDLEQQGYTYSLPGKGSFVAPQPDTPLIEKRQHLMEQMRLLLIEALYLGLEKNELIKLYEEVNATINRGDPQ